MKVYIVVNRSTRETVAWRNTFKDAAKKCAELNRTKGQLFYVAIERSIIGNGKM